MAIKTWRGLAPTWYTPVSEEGSEDPARFKLKPLNRADLDMVFEGRTTDSEGNLILTARGIEHALRVGLVDWENVLDENDKPLKFRIANFRYLPWAIGQELAGELVNMSFLAEDEAKNRIRLRALQMGPALQRRQSGAVREMADPGRVGVPDLPQADGHRAQSPAAGPVPAL